jgi:aryl-alcohol dehydrogenase-like predicted oxidoreductase
VSALSLGSWLTFEYLPREEGSAILTAARAAGIDFFDDARYDDRSGTAPIKTGYSEIVFGEIFRAAGLRRDEVVIANKLWWELWPQESAADELNGSLGRLGFDHVDLIYANPPPEGLTLGELVSSVGELLSSGKARFWGIVNWPAALIGEVVEVASGAGVPAPCAAQLPYSLVRRSPVEDEDMVEVLRRSGISVVASAVLAGGALTGKYASEAASGRLAGQRDDRRLETALDAGRRLRWLAERVGTTPAALAIAYTLANPDVASVLFGATSPAQVREDVSAVDVLPSMDDALLAELRQIEG